MNRCLLMSALAAAVSIWMQVERILLANISAWANTVGAVTALVALVGAFTCRSKRERRTGGLVSAIPLTVLVLAYPGLHLLRARIIQHAESRTTGTIIEVSDLNRLSMPFVRAEFRVHDRVYSTGWMATRRAWQMSAGMSVTIRYFEDDPRVAEIVVERPTLQ